MNIIFDKKICENFDSAVTKEWLETNNLGAYSSSTIYGLNSRRFHGLFVVPYGNIPDRFILLSKFEESVFFEKRIYELSTNQFVGGIYPEGYRYLENFSIDPFPKFTFLVENRRIEKTLFLLHDKNILIIRYEYKNQGPPAKLILKPIIGARRWDELSKHIKNFNTDSYLETKVVRIAPRPDIPQLNIYFQRGDYLPAPLWYHDFKYQLDTDIQQKNESKEDLFNPGFFSCILEPYGTLDLFISTETVIDFDYESIFRREKEYKRDINPKFQELPEYVQEISKKIETASITPTDKQPVMIPSYHHCENSMREALFSLFGFILVDRNYKQIKDIVSYLVSKIKDGLLPIIYPVDNNNVNYQTADCSLIFINLVFYLYAFIKDKSYLGNGIFESLQSIINAYKIGTRYNIHMEEDGLIYSGDKSTSTSWMPLINKEGHVLRYGKMLEINALWYNALKIMEYFCKELNKKRSAKKYAHMAETTKNSFIKEFWNDSYNHYYDLIRDDFKDDSLRISQIIVVGVPYPIPDYEQGEKTLKQIEEKLLTPYGLRTLSKEDKTYTGHLNKNINRSHPHYFTGSVWPWSIGLYINAVLKYRGNSKSIINKLKGYLDSYEKLYYDDGIGYISEIYEGDPPHERNGSIAHSISFTELFRSYCVLNILEKKNVEKAKSEEAQ